MNHAYIEAPNHQCMHAKLQPNNYLQTANKLPTFIALQININQYIDKNIGFVMIHSVYKKQRLHSLHEYKQDRS